MNTKLIEDPASSHRLIACPPHPRNKYKQAPARRDRTRQSRSAGGHSEINQSL